MAKKESVSLPTTTQKGPSLGRLKAAWRGLRDVKPQMIIALVAFVVIYATLFIVSLCTPALRDLINSWPAFLRFILSVFFALGFVTGGFAITMLLYLVVRRRKSRSKYMVEVITVLIVFLISWLLKVFVRFDLAVTEAQLLNVAYDPSFSEITAILLSSFYGALGGLSFEGLAYDTITLNLLYISFYYGSSIVAALVFVSVVASKAAYEFYSRILLFFLKTDGKQIFIFTALNEETLNLASSLVDEDRNSQDHNKLIIFSGSALEPFDRHDPHCVEVLSHGYIYWSVSARKSDSILRKIGLRSPRFGAPKWASVTVFAFDSDDDHIPNEEENMDFVLLDVHNRIQTMRARSSKAVKKAQQYLQIMKDLPSLEVELKDNEDLISINPDAVNRERIQELQALIPQYKAFLEESDKERAEELAKIAEQIEKEKEKAKSMASEKGLDVQDEVFRANQNVERRLRKANHLGNTHISYYILTKRKVDYQAYQDKITSLENEYRDLYGIVDPKSLDINIKLKKGEGDAKELKKELQGRWRAAMPFSIHVWNESDAIAHEAQAFVFDPSNEHIVPKEKQTRMWSVGFGSSGQALAKACYCFSAYVDREGRASTFLCDVFDPKSADELVGLLRLEMPLSVCLVDVENRDQIRAEYAKSSRAIYEKCFASFQDCNYGKEGLKEELEERSFEMVAKQGAKPKDKTKAPYAPETSQTLLNDLSRELPLPCFIFHNYAVGGEKTRNMFFDIATSSADPSAQGEKTIVEFNSSRNTGLEEKEDTQAFINPYQRYPDYIAVAAGDDYMNIRIANDIARHFVTAGCAQLVTIFVNVWDEKNNNLVYGFNNPGVRNPAHPQIVNLGTVRIIIVGNNADIYQCRRILEDTNAINYNYVYNRVSDTFSKKDANGYKENQAFSIASHLYYKTHGQYTDIQIPAEASEIARSQANLWDTLGYAEREEALRQWYSLALWKRVSSAEAYYFGPVYYRLLQDWKPNESEGVFFSNMCLIEHQRWMRRHIVDGWLPRPKKNEGFRYHPCIVPMAQNDFGTICYDLFNVFLGISLQNGTEKMKNGFCGQVDLLRIQSVKRQVAEYLGEHYPRVAFNKRDLVRCYSFGFDEFGEAMAETMFVHTADSDIETGSTNHFLCNAFLDASGKRAAIYRTLHPLAVVLTDKEATDIEGTSAVVIKGREQLDQRFHTLSQAVRNAEEPFRLGMSYPAYSFHELSLDEHAVSAFQGLLSESKYVPDYVALSLPDESLVPDYLRAIKMQLINLVKEAGKPEDKVRGITIFVRLFDASYLAQAEAVAANNPSWLHVCFIHDYDEKVEPIEDAERFYDAKMRLPYAASVDDFIGEYENNAPDYLANPTDKTLLNDQLKESIKMMNDIVSRYVENSKSSEFSQCDPTMRPWNKVYSVEQHEFEEVVSFSRQLKRLANDAKKREKEVDFAELICHLARLQQQRYVRSLIAESWTFREDGLLGKRRNSADLLPLACLRGAKLDLSLLYALLSLLMLK